MADPLTRLRYLAATATDAIRWACVLEATAPKAGNVYPGRHFDDLTHADFLKAAEIVACHFADVDQPMSKRMLSAVEQTASDVGNNVNLGIVLLLGPLVGADSIRTSHDWKPAIAQFLESLNEDDGQNVYRAIAAASPGGLGSVETNDIRSTSGPVDLVAAMTQAADRDRVAQQYATGFTDLIDNVMPVVRDAIVGANDVLIGISQAHLKLLAREPDSLIARKCGHDFAVQVRDRAAEINIDDMKAIERFDDWLRTDGHQRNPGTTADLMAASLYLLLRTHE